MIFPSLSKPLSSRPEQAIREANQLAEWRDLLFMREHNYRVYIMASKSRVIYIGMTNNLGRRVYEHQHDLIDGFSKRYRCHRLVYFESYDRVENAIAREKQLKRWNRAKKIFLIERLNPTWEDLSAEWGKPIEPLKQQVPPLAS